MLIKPLFQKFILNMMNNLCAKFGCHISSNNRDKQEGRFRPPPPRGIECFKSPRSGRVTDSSEGQQQKCFPAVRRPYYHDVAPFAPSFDQAL